MGKIFVLISCGKEKRGGVFAPATYPAKDLYVGKLFNKSRKYAEKQGDQWFILSAKFGLLHPNTLIQTYNLHCKDLSKEEHFFWSEQVKNAVISTLTKSDELIILAAKCYWEGWAPDLIQQGYKIQIPLKGKRIGEWLKWLNEQTNDQPSERGSIQSTNNKNSDNRLQKIISFYGLIDKLEKKCKGTEKFVDDPNSKKFPDKGVYFFFEPGETRMHSGKGMRVVRIGINAPKGIEKAKLWDRLRSMRGTKSGWNPGGGNHRGAVFRLHVGKALINRDKWSKEIISSWGVGTHAPRSILEKEATLERKVSSLIGFMPFLWMEVQNAKDRNTIERCAIALLSNYHYKNNPIDPPSEKWLGLSSGNEKIKRSGLWNSDYVDSLHCEDLLPTMRKWIE